MPTTLRYFCPKGGSSCVCLCTRACPRMAEQGASCGHTAAVSVPVLKGAGTRLGALLPTPSCSCRTSAAAESGNPGLRLWFTHWGEEQRPTLGPGGSWGGGEDTGWSLRDQGSHLPPQGLGQTLLGSLPALMCCVSLSQCLGVAGQRAWAQGWRLQRGGGGSSGPEPSPGRRP